MTQEEKQILIKDLCARLPYFENWVQYEGKDYIVTGYGHGRISLLPSLFSSNVGPCPLIEEVKPYLRPMSSMTEEERDEIEEMSHGWFYVNEDGEIFPIGQLTDSAEFEDAILPTLEWLNKNGFDYRGLIPMGLALEATEGMYKTE